MAGNWAEHAAHLALKTEQLAADCMRRPSGDAHLRGRVARDVGRQDARVVFDGPSAAVRLLEVPLDEAVAHAAGEIASGLESEARE